MYNKFIALGSGAISILGLLSVSKSNKDGQPSIYFKYQNPDDSFHQIYSDAIARDSHLLNIQYQLVEK